MLNNTHRTPLRYNISDFFSSLLVDNEGFFVWGIDDEKISHGMKTASGRPLVRKGRRKLIYRVSFKHHPFSGDGARLSFAFCSRETPVPLDATISCPKCQTVVSYVRTDPRYLSSG